jgi:hypothetical protein
MNNNACHDDQQAPGREHVKCEQGSMVVRVNHLVDAASGAAPDDGICFTNEFFVKVGTFDVGQILNFGSLAFPTHYCGKFH